MAERDWGNPPAHSTSFSTPAGTWVNSDPTTATLIAEYSGLLDRIYQVHWMVGASTGAVWRLEHCLSTALSSAGIRAQKIVYTGSNLSAEFLSLHKAEAGDLLRIVPASSFTGSYYGSIQVEILT